MIDATIIHPAKIGVEYVGTGTPPYISIRAFDDEAKQGNQVNILLQDIAQAQEFATALTLAIVRHEALTKERHP